MLTGACLLGLTIAIQASAPAPPAQTSSPAGPEPDRPFTELFQNLAHDFRALPSRQTGIVVAAGTAGALALHPADDNFAGWAAARGASEYTDIGDVVGDGWIQSGGAVAAYAVGVLSHQPRTTHIGSDLIRGQILNGVITTTTKVIAQRTRPNGGRRSFPSGHSSATFTSAAILEAHFGWRVGVPAYAVAGFVGWSRLRDENHWISDVIVGSAVGTAIGHTIARGHRTRGWTIVPAASAHGISVMLVKDQKPSPRRQK